MASSVDWKQSHVAFVTIVCTSIFTVLALISIVLKICTNIWISRTGFGLEDGLILAAFLISLALVGQIMWAVVDENEGQHLLDVATGNIEIIAKSLLVGEIWWSLVATLIRTATLLLFHKAFGVRTSDRALILILPGLVAAHEIAAVVVTLCICQPIRANWDHSVGHCGNQIEAYVAFEGFGLILDLALVVVPIFWIRRLRLSHHKKLNISTLFAIGSL
ncbi:hypothetical protein PG984_007172 [Apiospora sp. TS-2023a]